MEEQKKRRARRRFTDEFKARAVRLVLKDGQTAAQVARDLDLVESVLHGWVRQAKIDSVRNTTADKTNHFEAPVTKPSSPDSSM